MPHTLRKFSVIVGKPNFVRARLPREVVDLRSPTAKPRRQPEHDKRHTQGAGIPTA